MGYLIVSDYKKQIQSDNLNQVIGGDPTIQTAAELTATEEVTGYLVQKYDMTQELQDTLIWNVANAYKAGNRVFLNPSVFDQATIYTTGQYVVFAPTQYISNVYKSTAGSAAHAFVPGEWTLICPQYQIFSAKYPNPVFKYSNSYNVGDIVFWKDKQYTCRIATVNLSQQSALQYRDYDNIPLQNVAPDDLTNGVAYWGTGAAYAIAGATDILNTTFWVNGDNRSQMLVTYIVDITLYHLHSRIGPRQIPDLRMKRYDDAIRMLKNYAKGETTAAFPVLQPKQGGRIRWGGPVKNINSY